jgi:hypothetical protein
MHGEYSVKSGYNMLLDVIGTFGKSKLLRKQNIYFGGFVEVVFLPVIDFVTGVYFAP